MSNIYFKKIKIENFMSYEFAEIPLNKPGYIFVKGENRNPEDSASSNGCGKSTIFNAISWALTGKTTSGVSDVCNLYTKGETIAELEFECNSKNYLIVRTKNPSNLKIYINGEDKSGKGIRDSEKLLNEYLPDVTDYLLNSVIILGQGLPQRFTNNTPSGRKEVLELLSKSDFMIDDLKQRILYRREILNTDLRNNEDTLLQNKNTISILTSRLNDLTTKLQQLPNNEELITSISELKYEEKNLLLEKKSLIEMEQATNSNLKLIDENLLGLKDLMAKDIEELELEDTTDLEQLKNEAEWAVKNKLAEINKLKSVKDVCPTCGQKIPGVNKIDTTELEEELSHLREDYLSYSKSLSKIVSERNELMSIVNTKYDRLRDELTSIKKNTYEELKTIENRLDINNKNLVNCSNILTSFETKLSMLSEQKQSLIDDCNDIKNKLVNIEQENIVINNEIDNIKNHIDINSKMSTIVKRDFRGYLLTNVIDFISSRCSYYSKQVFNTDNLLFKLDGNNISISYDNKEYEVLSGGEKQKVDVILQLSIRDMLCSYLNFSSNILVLDEITDSLDIVGAQKIFNLISNSLTDVETIYIISHHTDFEIPCDDEIYIVKGDDKISRIV